MIEESSYLASLFCKGESVLEDEDETSYGEHELEEGGTEDWEHKVMNMFINFSNRPKIDNHINFTSINLFLKN